MDYPVDHSARGDNTHIIRCDIYNGCRHYAACQMTLRQIRTNSHRKSDDKCRKALISGECEADKMLKEEAKAGKAIYYTPRQENPLHADTPNARTNVLDPSYQLGWEKAGSMIRALRGKPEPKPDVIERIAPPVERAKPVAPTVERTKPKMVSTGNLYADLVNQLMKEHKGDSNAGK